MNGFHIDTFHESSSWFMINNNRHNASLVSSLTLIAIIWSYIREATTLVCMSSRAMLYHFSAYNSFLAQNIVNHCEMSTDASEYVTAGGSVQERTLNTLERTNLSPITALSKAVKSSKLCAGGFSSQSTSPFNSLFSFASLYNSISQQPYRTVSHFGLKLPMRIATPFHYHFPTHQTLTKYQPLTRNLSTNELFSTALYVSCPDRMVPKLFKHKKNLQEKLRVNRLCRSDSAAIFELKSNQITEHHAEDTSDALMVSHDSEAQTERSDLAQNIRLPHDAHIRTEDSLEPVVKSSHNRSWQILNSSSGNNLSERERQLLTEINDSNLDAEEEIFEKIRDSLLSKATRTYDINMSGDGSWVDPNLSMTTSSKSFRTSTPNGKSSESSQLSLPSTSFTGKTFDIHTVEPKKTAAKKSKIIVKVNINQTSSKKSDNTKPNTTKNFILENIRKASLTKPKTTCVNSGKVLDKAGQSHTKQKVDDASVRPFIKAKSANGSSNLWITVQNKSNEWTNRITLTWLSFHFHSMNHE